MDAIPRRFAILRCRPHAPQPYPQAVGKIVLASRLKNRYCGRSDNSKKNRTGNGERETLGSHFQCGLPKTGIGSGAGSSGEWQYPHHQHPRTGPRPKLPEPRMPDVGRNLGPRKERDSPLRFGASNSLKKSTLCCNQQMNDVSELHNPNTDSRKHSICLSSLFHPLVAAEGRFKELFHQFIASLARALPASSALAFTENKELVYGPRVFSKPCHSVRCVTMTQ